MKFDLWPTTIAVEHFPLDMCVDILNKYSEVNDKEWCNVITEEQSKMLLSAVESNFGKPAEIIEGWIRFVPPGGNNDFELHSDSHYGGDLVGVFNVMGDEGCGGNLVLYDPAWRNPQRVSDDVNPNALKHVEEFKVGKFTMFPGNVWHLVSTYTGTSKRLTLNLVIKFK